MKTLEIFPLEDKVLNVIMVEKEYNEPFWLVELKNHTPRKMLYSVFKPSIAFCIFLEKLVQRVNPKYVVEEQGNRTAKEFCESNTVAEFLKKHNVPFFAVDIDENARGYLTSSVEEKKALNDRIFDALDELATVEKQSNENSVKKEYLIAYSQCLQQEIEEAEQKVKFSIRENWIVMGIMDHARRFRGKEITCIYICSPEHVSGVKKLLESLDVKVEVIQPAKKLVSVSTKVPSKELSNMLESMQIQVKPVIKKIADEVPHLLFFLDTDKRASPFDICMAYDAGFSAVIPYEDVSPEDAKRIVQDTIFSRGPKGVRHTCFFIGGKDMEKAEEVLKVVRDTMFPPFETSVVIDPCGAYTTAAAMIAKVEESLSRSKLGDLKDKHCAIFGTGAVGRVAAILLTRLGCPTVVVSPNSERINGQEYIQDLSKLLRERYAANVEGIHAPTPTEKIKVMKKADVIFCASAAGIRVIEKEMLNEFKLIKLIADINAIPPLGVEGIKLEDDMREIAPGVFSVGALTIGKLKYELEYTILREVRRNGKSLYNYTLALQLARHILREKTVANELAVTLTYPPKAKNR